MLRFIVLFLIYLGVLFALELLQPVDRYVILPFTAAIAKVSVGIVGLFDAHAVAYGKILESTSNHFAISIERDGTVYLDDAKVAEDALPDALAKVATKTDADGKPPQVLLRADKGLDYGRVMAVMGDLNRAGLNRVALVSVGGDKE